MGVGGLGFRIFWPWDTGIKPIPAGYTRDTAHDGRYLQGDDNTFTGAVNGGAAHTHIDAGHTHTGNAHNHTFSAASTIGLSVSVHAGMAHFASQATHGHVAANSNQTTITYSTDPATIANTDMHPPWLQAILLKPDDIGQDIPDDGVCFGDSATLPTGFDVVAGGWDDKFIVGAAPAGVGGGTGGSATHTHVGTNHDHDPDDHLHAARLCGVATAVSVMFWTVGLKDSAYSQHHNVTLTTKALADVSQTQVATQAASSEPSYIKLLGLVNTSGAATTPPGVILPFVGAYADLPSSGEWILCDGAGGTEDCTDKQIKITTSTGEIGDTGGSDTHTHSVDAHTHTHGAHNHNSSATTISNFTDSGPISVLNTNPAFRPHMHTWTIGNRVPTMQTAAVTLSTDDGRYNYRKVIWVKYAPAAVTVKILGGTSLLGTTAIAAA